MKKTKKITKKSEIQVNFKDYNNKSRKGKYVYIKQPGKKPGVYKYDPKVPLDATVKYYKDKNRKNALKGSYVAYKKAFTEENYFNNKKANKTLRNINKRYHKKINEYIKKGRSTLKIDNAINWDGRNVKNAYKNLFKNLVLDKDVLNVISQESNVEKLKTRFEYKLKLFDANNKPLAEIRHIGKKTLNQIIKDLKETEITKNTVITDIGDSDGQGGWTFDEKIDIMRDLGYKWNAENNGKLHRIEVEVIFRR